MRAREIQDQMTIAGEPFVQQPANGNSEIPTGVLERNTISTVRSSRGYGLDSVAEHEPTAFSSFSTTRLDATKLSQTFQQLQGLAKPQAPRIAIKSKGRIIVLDVAGILAVQAEGNYISLRHRTNLYLLRESLSSIAEELKPYGFVRIHRSVIVNISTVEEIKALPTGEYRLRVRGGKEYLVTRTYKHNLSNLAQVWVGSSGFAANTRHSGA